MGKLFGFVVILLGIWIGMTIFIEGTDRAFGGIFASSGASSEVELTHVPGGAPLERIRDRVRESRNGAGDRVDRALSRNDGER